MEMVNAFTVYGQMRESLQQTRNRHVSSKSIQNHYFLNLF